MNKTSPEPLVFTEKPYSIEKDGVVFSIAYVSPNHRLLKAGQHCSYLGPREDHSVYLYDDGTAIVEEFFMTDIDEDKRLVGDSDIVKLSVADSLLAKTLFDISGVHYSFEELKQKWTFVNKN